MFRGWNGLVYLFSWLLLCCLCAPARAGLVAHWSFDDAAGASAASAVSGAGYAAGYFNAVPSSGVTFGHEGRFGNAVYFPGTAQNNLEFNMVDAMYSGSFTYSSWVKMESFDNELQFFGDWSGPDGRHAFRFFYDGGLSTNLRKDGGGGIDVGSNANPLGDGGWHLLTVVCDDAKGSLTNYIDGASVGTTAFAPGTLRINNSADTARKHQFGWKQDAGGGSGVFKGYMDETYIYDNALLPIQISNLYKYNSTELPEAQRFTQKVFRLDNLLGSTKTETLNDVAGRDTVGSMASADNLGVSAMLAGNGANFKGASIDLTGTGSKFNLVNLGVEYGGYESGIVSGRISASDGGRFNIKGIDWGLGMHADSYITFDLGELRAAGGIADDTLFHFLATAGCNSANAMANVNLAVIVWDENNTPIAGYVNGMQARDFVQNDGVWKFDAKGQTNDGTPGGLERVIADNQWITNANPWNVDVALGKDARYITLISADANGDINSDHGVFAGAALSIVQNGVLLNQLFGTRDTAYGLNYVHTHNSGQQADAADTGIVKTRQGNMNTTFSLNNASDAAGILFNATGLANGGGYGQIRSNMCGEDLEGAVSILTPTFSDGAIGIHANGMITFDLDELSGLRGWEDGTLHFSTTFASAHADPRNVTGLILVSNEADGVLQAFYQGVDVTKLLRDPVTSGNGYWDFTDPAALLNLYGSSADATGNDFDFDLADGAQYMSLFVLDGMHGIGASHGAFYDPWLTFIPNGSDNGAVPEPATWAMLLLGVFGLGIYRRRQK